MKRRMFLTNVATAGAAVGLNPGLGLAETQAHTARSAQSSTAARTGAVAPTVRALNRRMFQDAVSARFAVAGSSGRQLELLRIEDGPAARGLEQFSLVFREVGSDQHPVEASTHTLTHPACGEVALHLEPILDSGRGPCYRAALCLLS